MVRRLPLELEELGFDPADFEPYELPGLGTVSMTVPEAAEQLGIGQEQVRRLLREQRIIGVGFGGRAGWRVSRESVADYLAKRKAAAT